VKNNIRKYLNTYPIIDNSAYIDDSAVIIGDVVIGNNSSVWCNSVIRGDVNSITIGNNSNIQDLTMLHVSHKNPNKEPTEYGKLTIGDNVTVGHNCCLHACTIKNNILVGMGTTILDNTIINDNILIGAGSLVPPNKELYSGYLYIGNPVKQVRQLSQEEIEYLEYSALHYVKVKNQYILEKENHESSIYN